MRVVEGKVLRARQLHPVFTSILVTNNHDIQKMTVELLDFI